MHCSRVLIVEDERIIMLDLTDRLERFGCKVVGSCSTADEAIELAHAERPDLILMDIMLAGGRDGIDAAVQLRRELEIPVVFLTAYSDDQVIERAKEAEPYGFIVKPFKERELYSVIELAIYKAHMEERLHAHERLLDSILMTIDELVISLDSEHRIRFSNTAAVEVLGRSSEELAGREIDSVLCTYSEETNAPVSLIPTDTEPRGSYMIRKVTLEAPHGARIPVEGSVSLVRTRTGAIDGYTIALRDVSEFRRMTDTLSYHVSHDSLTGLLNRDEFITRMAQQLSVPHTFEDSNRIPAYIYADVDNFKVVNDVCGHPAGDELLRTISREINEHFSDIPLRVRVGDDEFGLFIPATTHDGMQSVAQRLHSTICRRFRWRDRTFHITASVAVVPIAPEDADPFGVLAAADDACYILKESGGDGIQTYRRGDSTFHKRRVDMHWSSLLSKAIDDERFVLYYQSIIDVASRVEAMREVLIRLIDEEGNIVAPGSFIPAAERYNLMPAIDRLVLRNVVEYISRDDESSLLYCVNLSGSTLGDNTLFDTVDQLCRENEVSPSRLRFEITETAAIQSFATSVELIEKLRGIGCSFSIDDFGNGFSSFAYLKRLPVDTVKIDGSFVQRVAEDSVDRAMVEAINNIGHTLSMTTIAEFVKNEETLQTLREIGVDFAQGYALAMPAPLEDLRTRSTGASYDR